MRPHTVKFYEELEGQVDSICAFVSDALADNRVVVTIGRPDHFERCVVRLLDSHNFQVRRALGDVIDVDAPALLEQATSASTLDALKLEALLRALLERASGESKRPVSVYSELGAVLADHGNIAAAVAAERLWTELAHTSDIDLLCGYSLGSFARAELTRSFSQICRAHERVLPVNEVASSEPELMRMRRIAELEQQARALETEIAQRWTTEARLALLASASELLTSSLEYDATLRNVIKLAMPAFGDFGFFDVVQDGGHVQRIAHAHNDQRREALLAGTHWVRSPLEDMNVCALSSGRAAYHPYIDQHWLERVATDEEHLKLMQELRFSSMISVPLVYHERTLGALTLFYGDSARHHTLTELELVGELARRAAAALENARLYRELQNAVRRQEEADRRKDEFLAMLGHELRNPLAPILTALQLMELRGETLCRREREVIKRQSLHLTRLVDDLLDVSRVARGKVTLKKERLELSTVIAKAIEMASPLFEQRAHNLEIKVPSVGLELDADPVRFAQVLANLLTNAAKYTEPGGHIAVRAERAGAQIVVEVVDDGCGIATERLSSIFDLFVQSDWSLDRSHGGLGLGLSLVKSLTELHGGNVTAHSRGPGTGSTFTVRLPAVMQPERPALVSPLRSGLRLPHGAALKRVLVVDDNDDAAQMIYDALSTIGYEVEVAHDGPEALAAAERHEPNIALLDIGLPVMDGYELAERLRERFGSAIRLIAVTGYGQDRDRERSRGARIDEHLVKPVKLDLLVEALEARH